MPFSLPSAADLMASLISATVVARFATKLKSTTETFGVGKRIDVPSSLPFSSGRTRPTALAAPVEREPTDPPARRVAPVRVHHVEPDHAAVGPYGGQRVRRPVADGGDDVGQRAEEAVNLGRIEVKGQYAPEVGTADTHVNERLGAPDGGHDALMRLGRKLRRRRLAR